MRSLLNYSKFSHIYELLIDFLCKNYMEKSATVKIMFGFTCDKHSHTAPRAPIRRERINFHHVNSYIFKVSLSWKNSSLIMHPYVHKCVWFDVHNSKETSRRLRGNAGLGFVHSTQSTQPKRLSYYT